MRIATVLAVAVLLGASLVTLLPQGAAGAGEAVLTVGDRAEMTSRNVLRASLGPYGPDDASAAVLGPVYSSLLITTDRVRPYIAKGVDADGDGVFEANEHGAFSKSLGTNQTDITVYLDFNGVRWHDGVQMDAMDLLFSLEVESLDPLSNAALLSLWDRAGGAGSNFTWDRWLAVGIAPKAWAGEAALQGDPALRTAVRFRLQTPFVRFYDTVLGSLPILPRHVWELAGGGRHADFGRAVYPESDPRAGRGIPVNETTHKPFDFAAASAWEPADADVIGSGPFRFLTWVQGAFADLARNDEYYVGTDPSNPATVYDAQLAAMLHRPYIEKIRFAVYRTVTLGVLALQTGAVDHYRASIPPEFVPDLLGRPEIRIWANADPGFAYLGYNMRRVPFGYVAYPPADSARDDGGRPLRLAFAHIIDKETHVLVRLFNYAYVANNGPVSDTNTLWYNGTLPVLSYDLAEAARILDGAGWPDPPGPCLEAGTGCRSLPAIGNRSFEILTPAADVEPARASMGSMIAQAARAVGLNAIARSVPISGFGQKVTSHDFDMYVGQWHITDPDPDFLYGLYDCRNSGAGPNYPGYCSSEFDRVIERSRTEMDLDERVHLVKWAQGILMADRPIEPLYFPMNLLATRDDRFVNWSVNAGALWDFWSWIGVRPVSQLRPIIVSLEYGTAMVSGGQQRLAAFVKESDGSALAGATVTFRILPQDGGRFLENSAREITGTTTATGTFTATYEAPLVPTGYRDIGIEGIADHNDARGPVQNAIVVTVFSATARFLSLRVSLPAGDLGLPDTPLPLNIEVRDDQAAPTPDAAVEATVLPGNATLSRGNGTAQEMASLVFTPPPDLRSTQWYRVSLNATKAGFFPAHANVSLLVVAGEPANPPPPPPLLQTMDIALILGGAAAVAVVALLGWAVWRRHRRG